MNILYVDRMRKSKNDEGKLMPFVRDEEKEYILGKYGDRVIYPEIFWDRGNYLSAYLSHVLESNKIDAIVGYSAGGYMALQLSNKYKLPALVFNPAIAENCKAPELQPPDRFMKESPMYKDQLIVLGSKDTKDAGGVEYSLVVEYLKKIQFEQKGGEIATEPIEHAPDGDIFDKYFTYFHEKFLKRA